MLPDFELGQEVTWQSKVGGYSRLYTGECIYVGEPWRLENGAPATGWISPEEKDKFLSNVRTTGRGAQISFEVCRGYILKIEDRIGQHGVKLRYYSPLPHCFKEMTKDDKIKHQECMILELAKVLQQTLNHVDELLAIAPRNPDTKKITSRSYTLRMKGRRRIREVETEYGPLRQDHIQRIRALHQKHLKAGESATLEELEIRELHEQQGTVKRRRKGKITQDARRK